MPGISLYPEFLGVAYDIVWPLCSKGFKFGPHLHLTPSRKNIWIHLLMIHYLILQVNQLAYCTDRHHVENLKAIHLSSITDVIKAINHQVDVASCSVYTEKTLVSATSESNVISHHQQQPPQPQITASKASSDVWLSFWLLSAAMSLSLRALRD